jgi:S1-C subfamily serine protease
MESGDVWGQLPELARKKKKNSKRARMGVVVDRAANEAVVKSVHPDSPAEKAGIRAGDVITRFDNRLIANAGELIDLIKSKRPGSRFYVEIKRDGYYFSVNVQLEEF